MMEAASKMLMLDDIGKRYGKHRVLEHVSLTLDKGEALCIAGANGCGKSTLLKMVAGVIKPDSGEIKRFGRTGYVPQEDPLIDELTVRDNLCFWYGCRAGKVARICEDELIKRLGIGEYLDKRVSKLSGGMKKRVSIACACGNSPDILVMDEPGASLDIVCKADIRDFVRMFTASGRSVIYTSHEDAEIDMADRMAVIAGGRITQLSRVLSGSELLEYIKNGATGDEAKK